ncbi:hypothetical protein EsH8_VI_000224 [Colletotrichum jinshuiense]
MPRPSAVLVLLGLLSAGLAVASPEFDQEEDNRNSSCDNGCFFGSFPGGSCTNDAACMCTQQKYREAYFCCMAQKCAASVLPASIQRQNSECGARNMPFTFDVEAVCGIKLTTSTTASSSAASTATGDPKSSAASASSTAASATVTSEVSSTGKSSDSSAGVSGAAFTGASVAPTTGSQTSSAGSTASTTPSSAPADRVAMSSLATLVAMSVLLLL